MKYNLLAKLIVTLSLSKCSWKRKLYWSSTGSDWHYI